MPSHLCNSDSIIFVIIYNLPRKHSTIVAAYIPFERKQPQVRSIWSTHRADESLIYERVLRQNWPVQTRLYK